MMRNRMDIRFPYLSAKIGNGESLLDGDWLHKKASWVPFPWTSQI